MWWEFHRLMDLTPEQLIDEDDPIGLLDPDRADRRVAQGQADLALSLPGSGLRSGAAGHALRPDPQAGRTRTASCRLGRAARSSTSIAAALTVDIQRDPIDAASPGRSCRSPWLRTTAQHRSGSCELGEWVAEHGIDGDGPSRAVARSPPRPTAAGRAGSTAKPLRPTGRDRSRRGPPPRPRPRSDRPADPGATGFRQDVQRRPDDLYPARERRKRRDHRHQSQGHRQPARRGPARRADDGGRRRAADPARPSRQPPRRRSSRPRAKDAGDVAHPARRRPGEPGRRDVMAVGVAEDGRRGRRAVRRRSRPDLPGQRRRDGASASREHRAARRSAAARPAAAGLAPARRGPIGPCACPRGTRRRCPPDRGLFLETHVAAASRRSRVHLRGLLRRSPGVRGPPRGQRVVDDWRRSSTASARGCSTARRREPTTSRPTRRRRSPSSPDRLIEGGATWTDQAGLTRRIGWDDVLIVAPYNAQVGAIKRLAAAAPPASGPSTSSRARRPRSASTR